MDLRKGQYEVRCLYFEIGGGLGMGVLPWNGIVGLGSDGNGCGNVCLRFLVCKIGGLALILFSSGFSAITATVGLVMIEVIKVNDDKIITYGFLFLLLL